MLRRDSSVGRQTKKKREREKKISASVIIDSLTRCMLSIKALQFYVELLIYLSLSPSPTLTLWSESHIPSIFHLCVNLSSGHVASHE